MTKTIQGGHRASRPRAYNDTYISNLNIFKPIKKTSYNSDLTGSILFPFSAVTSNECPLSTPNNNSL